MFHKNMNVGMVAKKHHIRTPQHLYTILFHLFSLLSLHSHLSLATVTAFFAFVTVLVWNHKMAILYSVFLQVQTTLQDMLERYAACLELKSLKVCAALCVEHPDSLAI